MSNTKAGRAPSRTSLRELLAHYDTRVRDALSEAAATTTGTSRVQALHLLGRLVSAHDSVVGSALCPLLADLPGGPELAADMRKGCEERAALLERFHVLSQGTAARNVYPVLGAEVEAILEALTRSFEAHMDHETTRVTELLESAAPSLSPEVVAARMAIEAARAPARAHRALYRHPTSKAARAFYRGSDYLRDWFDSHHGWPRSRRRPVNPVRPPRRYDRRPPSVPELLSGYDQTVEVIIAEVSEAGRDGTRRAEAGYRLAAAIAVHDAIVGGTLCPLLQAVPESRAGAAVLENGCRERARLLAEWNGLVEHSSPALLFATRAEEADRVIDGLIASFRTHETHETEEVSSAVEHLRQRPWKSAGTGLISPYLLPDWPNPEPGVLAAHMALWAEKAPTHPHPLLGRHPTNRMLRDLYRYADGLRDRRRARHGWPRLT